MVRAPEIAGKLAEMTLAKCLRGILSLCGGQCQAHPAYLLDFI